MSIKAVPLEFHKLNSAFSNIAVFNALTFTLMAEPLQGQLESLPVPKTNHHSKNCHPHIHSFRGGKHFQMALKMLSTSEKVKNKERRLVQPDEKGDEDSFIWFSRQTINEQTNEKVFKIVPSNSSSPKDSSTMVHLDQATRLTFLNQELFAAIERRYVTLYQVDGSSFRLKDYDSAGMSAKFNCI